jgi:hypothetical protein
MRTRVIPAQITTVEDKIVGSLNLMQMLILMAPVFFTTLIYSILPPTMSFVVYKLIVSAVVFVTCLLLSLRIKGKVVVDWLAILLRYNLRAKYYIYNKNENHLRTMYLPSFEEEKVVKTKQVKVKAKKQISSQVYQVKNLVNWENLVGSQDMDFRYKVSRKGGLNVAFEQIKK